jgi:hypothetical protein
VRFALVVDVVPGHPGLAAIIVRSRTSVAFRLTESTSGPPTRWRNRDTVC